MEKSATSCGINKTKAARGTSVRIPSKFIKLIAPLVMLLIFCGTSEAAVTNFVTPTSPYPSNALGSGYYLKSRADGALASDNFGYSVNNAGDVNNDGKSDIIIGAYNADPGGRTNAGSAYIYSGASGVLLYQYDGGTASDALGFSVSTAGDVNGDGYADFMFGAHGYDPTPLLSAAGTFYVYSGFDGSLLYQKDGTAVNFFLGIGVSVVGDLNADGKAEFLAGAQGANPQTGTAYVYNGADGTALYTKTGGAAGDAFGAYVSNAGDVSGDGVQDFMVAANAADFSALNAGSVYVYSGADGSQLYRKDGQVAADGFGSFVGPAGDVNGDGRADFTIGAWAYDVPGGAAGSVYVYSGIDGSLLYQKNGAAAAAQAGRRVGSAGDLDGDGKSEFMSMSILSSGSWYIYSGADSSTLLQKSGAMSTPAGDRFGWSFSSIGDNNLDGKNDFVVGAYLADNTALTDSGSAYIFLSDFVLPTVTNNQSGDTTWRATDPGAIYDVDFSDAGGANLDYVQYSVWTGAGLTGTNTIAWTNIASGVNAASYATNWGAAYSSLAQGQSYVSVRAVDFASNTSAVATDAFFIKKDTAAPTATNNQGGDNTWRNSNTATYDVDFSDANSGLDKFQTNACTTNTNCSDIIAETDTVTGLSSTTTYTTDWSLPAAVWAALPQGQSYISAKYYDAVGNYATSSPLFYVKKDTVGPSGGSISYLNGNSSSSISITFATGTDPLSGYASATLQRQSAAFASGTCGSYSGWANLSVNPASSPYTDATVADGTCYQYRLISEDAIGNTATDTAAATATIDTTAPAPGSLTLTSGGTPTYTGLSFAMSAGFTDAGSQIASCSYCKSVDGVCDTEWASSSWSAAAGTCSQSAIACSDGQSLTLIMLADDNTGNSSQTAALSRTCEGTAPAVSFNAPPGSSTQTAAFQIDISESDAQSGLSTCEYMAESYNGGWSTTRNWTSRTCNSATSATISVGPGLDCQALGQNSCRVSVRSTDAGGNVSASVSRTFNSDDVTGPSTAATVNDGEAADSGFASSATQLTANWTAATDVESGIAKYWYSIGTTAGASDVVSWTDNGTATLVTKTGLALTEGNAYYFSVSAVNGAGMISSVTSSNGQVVDSSAPSTVATVNDSLGSDVFYSGSQTQLSANWTSSSDGISGVAKYWYSIGTSAGASDTASWTDNATATTVTKTGLVLTPGVTYYFSVKAENGSVILSTPTNSNGQTIENSPPGAITTVNDGTASDTAYAGSQTQLSANWTDTTDPESGVAKYWYSIGTSAGASDTVSWTDNAAATSVTKTGLVLAEGAAYYFSVKAENGSGLISPVTTSNGQTVETSNPGSIASVNDGVATDISYTTTSSQLSANWSAATDAQSGIAKYWYSVGTSAGASDTVSWTDNATPTSVTKTGLALTDGVTYYFSVKAENGFGLMASIATSNGQTVDTTAPAAVATVSDGLSTDIAFASSSSTQLSANWSAATDAGSGIATYWYAIGTTSGATDVVDWTNNGASVSVTKTGLALTDGQAYYISVKAENNAGLVSSVTTSNGQTVDTSAPATIATVNDGTGADETYALSTTQLSANWSDSADPHTGVVKYWFAIGTTSGGTQVQGWTDNGAATSVTQTGLALADGATCYISVKAENGAGVTSIVATSNGQIVETSAPGSIATLNDGTGSDTDYTASTTQLDANWTAATDAQSGVTKYWYSIGTSAGASDTVTWTNNATATSISATGLTLIDGAAYYISVKAENGIGLIAAAANSDGVTVDTTAPSAAATVNDGTSSDAAFAVSATQLSANWTAAADPTSGIAKYWYAIGSTSGATDVLDWTDNATPTSVTKTGLSLTGGQAYYVSVKAENGSGLLSTVTTSNGQTVDSTPPSTVSTVYDGTGADEAYSQYTDRLSANWSAAADAETGVTKYWYSIGTTAGASNTLAWTDNSSATSVTKTGLALTEGQTYYISVKAENTVGLLSTAANSNGSAADAASPSVTITSPAAGANVNGSYNVTGSVSDTSLSSWTLSYGSGSSPSSWTTIATGSAQVSNALLGVWNASSLSGSYTLKLTATDSFGRTSQTTTAAAANSSTAISGTVSKFKWTLLSAPVQPATPDPVAMFGSTGLYKVYRWDPSTADQQYYAQYKYPSSISAGQGFWIASFYNDLPYSYTGNLADTTQTFTLPVKTGWNQIGTPFNRNYTVSAIQVKYNGTTYSLATAASMGLISATLNGYDSSASSWTQKDSSAALEPQIGYFARAYQDIDLLFDPAVGQGVSLAKVVRVPYEYKIKLSASAGESADKDNYITAGASALSDYDQFDAEEPPAAPEGKYTALYFPHETWTKNAGRYANDSRPAAKTVGQTETWDFNIDTNEAGQTITISWDGAKLPTDKYTFTLVNAETGQRTAMAAQNSYSFTAPNTEKSTSRFKIEAVKTTADAIPSITRTHTLGTGWRLVSAPVEPDATSASAIFGQALRQLDIYQLADGKFYSDSDADIQAGLGYWINSNGNTDITIQGKPAEAQVTVPLKTGWNIIGNPYETSLAWGDNITLSCNGATLTLSQAAASSYIDPKLYEYDGNGYITATTLEPWHGYLLKAKVDCDLTLKQ